VYPGMCFGVDSHPTKPYPVSVSRGASTRARNPLALAVGALHQVLLSTPANRLGPTAPNNWRPTSYQGEAGFHAAGLA
jgi:hypothetical protein